jgi:predicted Fe-S protein YdhL (DUF1289 family)
MNTPAPVAPAITSPCIGLCKLDAATGYCLGCARTGDEIATWRDATGAARGAIWAALPARFDQLGVTVRRRPWDRLQIRDEAAARLQAGPGTWVMGVPGAVAEFTAAPGARVDIETSGDTLIARTSGARLRMVFGDHVRALELAGQDAGERLILAVKREAGRPERHPGLTLCGPDTNAIDPADRDAMLVDLGIDRSGARFCVRLRDGAALASVRAAEGLPLIESLPRIGAALVTESPTRVIETALGRIEVDTRIPPPGGVSPAGPHTHLLPDHLATGRAMPPGMDLPRAYLPGAIFYGAG